MERSQPVKTIFRSIVLSILILFWLGLVAPAQSPHFVNAKFESVAAGSNLQQQFQSLIARQAAPGWFGYAAPAVAGNGVLCCFDSVESAAHSACGRCRLETLQSGIRIHHSSPTSSPRAQLEAPEVFFILFRVAARRVGKIRLFSPDCELDAGGLPVVWLTDVSSQASIPWLSSFVHAAPGEDEATRHLAREALAAVALHKDDAADAALDRWAAAGQPEFIRKQAVFWLGSARGEKGYQMLRRIVKSDSSDQVREQAVFALSISKAPQAVETMIDVAHNDASAHVRGQALFWLAQKAGRKAVGAITEAIERDPETEVKRRAVFALSQLPKDEGIPKLIEVAQSNRNPAVRKQAIFWLGQSHDPRALKFIEDILTH